MSANHCETGRARLNLPDGNLSLLYQWLARWYVAYRRHWQCRAGRRQSISHNSHVSRANGPLNRIALSPKCGLIRTKRNACLLLMALAMTLIIGSSTAIAQGQPEVIAEIDKNRIYEGESVHYRVTLNHVENPQEPVLEGFEDFDVQPAGQQSLNSRKIVITPSGRQVTQRFGRAYDYVLTPRRAGLLEIPAPRAEIDGETLVGNRLSLRVTAPDDQDVVILSLGCDRPYVYPMQPFTVSLTVSVKSLPRPRETDNPLSVQREPPALSIPWAMDDELPDGLIPKRSSRQWLRGMQSGRDGFSINDLQEASLFSSFFSSGALRFLPAPSRVRRTDDAGSVTRYWNYSFDRVFSANRVGTYRFGPVAVKGVFGTRVSARNQLQGEDIYALASPIDVIVKDAPLEGRPNSYSGAIGRFDVVANLVPTKAKVGDPITLTLRIQGQGTLDSIVAPDLETSPEFSKSFKAYEATSQTQRDGRVFTYSFRPLTADIERFPRIPFSYFDVDSEQYITVKTEPIPLEITAATRLKTSDITRASNPDSSAQELETRQDGIFANKTDRTLYMDQSVDPARWFVGLGTMVGLYVVIAITTKQVRRISGNEDRLRRRAAPNRAKQRMREALAEIESGQLRDAADHLRSALVGLVADVEGIPQSGLTTADVGRHLGALNISRRLSVELSKLLEACDHARYGASAASVQGLGREADRVMDELIQELRKENRVS